MRILFAIALAAAATLSSVASAQTHWSETPCPDYDPPPPGDPEPCFNINFCDGMTLPGSPPSPPKDYDARYATFNLAEDMSGACAGVAWGPHTIMTAAHCVEGTMDADDNVFASLYRSAPLELERYMVMGGRVHPDFDISTFPFPDVAFLRTVEPIPPPYVNTIYNALDSQFDCTRTFVQGYTDGDPWDCDWLATAVTRGSKSTGIGFPFVFQYYTRIHGGCIDPWWGEVAPGDSGAPFYAIVDADGPGGADPVYELAGLVSQFYFVHLHAYETWINANQDLPDTFATLDNGIEIVSWSQTNRRKISPNMTITAYNGASLGCQIELNATGDPVEFAGCEIADSLGHRSSCTTALTNQHGLYECQAQIPPATLADWQISKLFAVDSGGDYDYATVAELETAWDPADLKMNGATRLAGGVTDTTAPTVSSLKMSQWVAPGEDVLCAINATDNASLKEAGCAFTAAGFAGSLGGWSAVSGPWKYAFAHLSDAATVGQTVDDVYGFARDQAGNYATGATDTFQTFDCTDDTEDFSITGPGWGSSPGTRTTTFLGGIGWIEFYARATVSNQDAVVAFSDIPITTLSEARAAIRFNASGTIDALDDGQWVQTYSKPYTANQWYRFILQADLINPGWTAIQSTENQYNVFVAQCGGPFSRVRSAAVQANGRNVTGIKYWNAWSSQAAAIEIQNLSTDQATCVATSCLFESPAGGAPWTWECGTPQQNGCNGTINCAGTCTLPEVCGALIPYVCDEP